MIKNEEFKKWCEAGSNRRHKDFQSFALPTELSHHFKKHCKGTIFMLKKKLFFIFFI